MKTSRRDFLKVSSTALLGAGTAGLVAPRAARADDGASGPPPPLVVIYLRGGSDGLNLVVPFSDPLYYEYRPTIAIARPGAEGGCLPLDPRFGLHPAAAPLHALYEQKMLAPIVNVGSPHPTRSHFDAQDFMEYAAPGARTITEGWLNRYLTASHEDGRKEAELRALAMQPLLPRALRGEFPVLAVPDIGATGAMDAFESLYMCEKGADRGKADEMKPRADAKNIVEAGQNTIRTLRRFQEITTGSRGPSNGAQYPQGGLGDQLRKIAQVIKADCGLEVAAIDYGGWDHHARQGGAQGAFATMIGNLSASIAAFLQDLGTRAGRVLVLTMSEFGRTVMENGNEGSDHGHGGYMLAAGGMVNGGRVYGNWTGLERSALYEDRDMPVHTDFRLVFLEVLYRLFGLRGELDTFFPDWRAEAKALEFLRQA